MFSIVQPECKYLRGRRGGADGGRLSVFIQGCVHLSERRRENECIIDDGVGVLKLLLLSRRSGALKTSGCSAATFRGASLYLMATLELLHRSKQSLQDPNHLIFWGG